MGQCSTKEETEQEKLEKLISRNLEGENIYKEVEVIVYQGWCRFEFPGHPDRYSFYLSFPISDWNNDVYNLHLQILTGISGYRDWYPIKSEILGLKSIWQVQGLDAVRKQVSRIRGMVRSGRMRNDTIEKC